MLIELVELAERTTIEVLSTSKMKEEAKSSRGPSKPKRDRKPVLSKLVSDIGHIVLQVGSMDEALKLYRDTLGFEVKEQSPEWTVVTTKLGELTLYKTPKTTPLVLRDSEDTPINLHVTDFQKAADILEKKGYRVKRRGRNSGILHDPWGNTIALHDHRKA